MERKLKLAKWILMEVEALQGADKVNNMLALATEITKDAMELAKIIENEAENKEVA